MSFGEKNNLMLEEIKKDLLNIKLSTTELRQLIREVKEKIIDPDYESESESDEEEEEVSNRDIENLKEEKIEVGEKDGFYFLKDVRLFT
tara:strand:+ start:21 stop:287 length:267 start_codon:yes stop_codon:yes gene_type:complete